MRDSLPKPLRCDDVIRALSVPSTDADPCAMTDHLAKCAACRALATGEESFNRLWDATRPPEPSESEWERVWSRVTEGLDKLTVRAPQAAVFSLRLERFSLVLLAQAALIFLAVGLWFFPGSNEPVKQVVQQPPLLKPVQVVAFEFDPGVSPMIHDGLAGTLTFTAVPLDDENPNGDSANLAMFNAVETMAVAEVDIAVAVNAVLRDSDVGDILVDEVSFDEENPNALASNFDMLNTLEAMAGTKTE